LPVLEPVLHRLDRIGGGQRRWIGPTLFQRQLLTLASGCNIRSQDSAWQALTLASLW
jgi:hypothetical protein